MRWGRRVVVAAMAATVIASGWLATSETPVQPTFAGRIAALSEPGGYFDTDNLISNERSFLHVVPRLREAAVQGGAYLGVGPDQNFSYIAHARPAIAILVDIRRDNLLLHLLFKALFGLAPTRAEYLAALVGRAPVADLAASASIDEIVAAVDASARLPEPDLARLAAAVRDRIDGFGVPVSPADHDTIRRFHRRFIDAGLSLRFNSSGRPPQWNYPTYRDLILETDRDGIRRSYLADESGFQFVRSLQSRDLVVPVVGDVAGETALPAIADFLEARGTPVSVFYVSNVEFYLFRQGGFDGFVRNVERLPLAPGALVVRSAFTGARPDPGYNSASMTQEIGALVAGYADGRIRGYRDLLLASR